MIGSPDADCTLLKPLPGLDSEDSAVDGKTGRSAIRQTGRRRMAGVDPRKEARLSGKTNI